MNTTDVFIHTEGYIQLASHEQRIMNTKDNPWASSGLRSLATYGEQWSPSSQVCSPIVLEFYRLFHTHTIGVLPPEGENDPGLSVHPSVVRPAVSPRQLGSAGKSTITMFRPTIRVKIMFLYVHACTYIYIQRLSSRSSADKVSTRSLLPSRSVVEREYCLPSSRCETCLNDNFF